MREADVEENEILTDDSTIRRAPKLKSHKSKKKEQQLIYENDIDTNNNTLKRNNDYDNISQVSDNNSTLKKTSTISSNGIPSVPGVHMGAGFMKIFNQCPLDIHASYCWINSETKGDCLKYLPKFYFVSWTSSIG
jgi:hypothetical protein